MHSLVQRYARRVAFCEQGWYRCHFETGPTGQKGYSCTGSKSETLDIMEDLKKKILGSLGQQVLLESIPLAEVTVVVGKFLSDRARAWIRFIWNVDASCYWPDMLKMPCLSNIILSLGTVLLDWCPFLNPTHPENIYSCFSFHQGLMIRTQCTEMKLTDEWVEMLGWTPTSWEMDQTLSSSW